LRSSARNAARVRDKATLTRRKASENLVQAIDMLENIEDFKLQMVDREAKKKATLRTI
jgi:hypothetical protein